MLHDEAIVSLISPCEPLAIVSQVDEVAVIEEVIEHGHTSTVWEGASKLLWCIKVLLKSLASNQGRVIEEAKEARSS